MGLIGWWPLNGDTKDYSGNGRHGDLIGNPLLTGGKIGQAYHFTTNSHYISIPHDDFLSSRAFGDSYFFSLSGWVYIEQLENWACIINKSFGSSWSNTTAGLWVSDSNGITFAIGANIGGNPSGSSRLVNYTKTNFELNKWIYVVGVATDSGMFLYIDGNLVGQTTLTLSMDRTENTEPITIGRRGIGSNPSLKGKINDVRIYDHALSEKEIKELAKAKVLHYKFDDFQEPTENLLHDYIRTMSGWSGATLTRYEGQHVPEWSTQDATRIIISGGTSTTKAARTFVPNSENGGRPFSVTCYVKNIGNEKVSVHANHGHNWVEPGESTFIQRSFIGSGSSHVMFNITVEDASHNVDIFIYKAQLEEKGYATPFTPSIREGTILDCSGYENHAELALATTPKWTEESKLGSGAYEFSLEQQIISNGLSFLSNVDGIENPISISLWANGKSSVGAYDGIFNVCDSNDGYSGLTCNITSDTAKRIRYWQDGGTTRAWSSPQSIGHWNHVVVVLSNNRTIVYENGEEVRNDAFTNPFSFGHRIHWGLYLYATSWYDGYLDDIRIYATALSDEDVLELYQTRASLDDGGNLNINNGIIETKHKPLIMDYTIWEDGQTGTIGSFGQYSSNNQRVRGLDPWGNETILWQGISLEGSTAGTGIYHSAVPIDNTKTYRMSWWEKRVTNATATYARYYAGLNGYGSVAGVGNLTNETPNTNPYFWNTSHTGLTEGEWFLVVGHVHPYTYTGATHSDSGRYNFQGKIGNIATDYRWLPETTTARSRTLMIYTPNAGGVIHQTAYPRMDICDGTEPSLQDLLNGFDSNHYDYVKAKGGKANIVMDMKDQETVFGEVSEIGPTNGLVAWYPLDGHADDIGGNGHHGTVNNIDFSVGMAGLSAHSSGSGYIDTLDLRNYNVFENELTVCMWYNPNTIINHIFMSTGQSRGNANHNARLYAGMRDNGQVDLGIQGSGWAGTPGTIPIAANSWSFIAIRMKQGIADLFINGEKEKTKTYTSYVLNSDLRILAHDNNYYHNSAAENVRIYNRALSDEEIGILYDMTRPDGPAMKQTDTTLYIKGEIKEV